MLDVFKTHFADDTQGLYQGLGKGSLRRCHDEGSAWPSRRDTSPGAWACPTWTTTGGPISSIVTGNVYPETERELPAYPYRMPPMLFRNLGNGRFEQLVEEAGPGVLERHSSRGLAFGDIDNDGDIDIVVWNRNEPPSLLRNDLKSANTGRGAADGHQVEPGGDRFQVTVEFAGRKQVRAVLSQWGFTSASDLRLHFGLGAASTAEVVVRWPTGMRERFAVPGVDRVLSLVEGQGTAVK